MNFLEFLELQNVETTTSGHHSRTGWVQFDCPFCDDGADKSHMGYNVEKNYVNCWKCGGHRLVDAVARIAGVDRSEAYKLIDRKPGPAAAGAGLNAEPAGTLTMPFKTGQLRPPQRKYLERRGFDPDELVERWGIAGIGPEAPKYALRIFIPITYQRRVVSWTTRAISDSVTLRYKSAKRAWESINHKRILYGLDLVGSHSVAVVEGPLDAWAIGPGTLGTFGTGFTSAQIRLIAEFPLRVLCFDNEAEAQKRAKWLAEQLSVFPGETYNVTFGHKDPAETMRKAPREIMRFRRRFLE